MIKNAHIGYAILISLILAGCDSQNYKFDITKQPDGKFLVEHTEGYTLFMKDFKGVINLDTEVYARDKWQTILKGPRCGLITLEHQSSGAFKTSQLDPEHNRSPECLAVSNQSGWQLVAN
ncbi:hypothetical protein [Pseudomonas leptonychotis]|jgi:hypothetical protein|uniref:hypothetical protein n=1 Tax=Pseudomonas leptonychotis TaxID=2448482 RepID=UPI0038647EE6